MNLLRILIGLSMLGFSLAAQAQWTPLPAAGQVSVPLDAEPGAVALADATRVLAVGTASPAGVVLVNPDSGAIISRIALGAHPRALAIDASASRVYVIDEVSANSVKVLDVATATVVANWSLGGELSALALTPSGNQLIVADRAGKKLLTIAVANGTLVRADSLAGNPELLAFGKQGSRLLVGLHGGRLLTLDAATYGVLGNLPTGDEIRGLAWWDDGDMALTVGKNADALNYFPGGTVVSPPATPIGGDPRELSTDEALDRAFVTTPRDMSVYRVELATRQIAGRYPLPGRTRSLVFDPLARMLLLPLIDDRALLRLDPQTATLVSPLLLGKWVSALAVNPVTHKAAVVADKAQELSRIDIGLRTAEILALPAMPRLVAIDSAIDRAVIAAGPNAKIVHFVDLATGVLLPETILAEYGIVALAVDSTRGLALALRKKTDGLLVIDTRNRTVVASIALDADYSSLAIHSARGMAYLGGRQRITPLDLTNLTLGPPRTLAIHAEALAVDEALDVLVATDRPTSSAHVFRLTDFSVRDVFTLPLRPAALAIQPDTHVAVIASPESDALSTVNLETGAVQAGFVTVEKPFALAVSQRYNQALVLSAKTDLLEFVQLPNPLPRFEALNPNRALVGSAALVINAEGGNFVDGAKVIFGSTTLVTRWIHSGRLEADLPASLLAAAGTISVRVRNPAPAGGDSVARSFEVLPPPPVLDTVSPSLIEAEGQDKTITLTGQNFTAASLVVFDGQTIASQIVSTTQLSATVPGSLLATERVAPVWVTTVSGQSNTINVTVETARPVIDAISPTTGAPGITVTISGRGFDAVASGNQVRFGESGLAEVVSATRTQVVAKVPATARTGAVSLATSKGVASGPVFTVIREQDFDLTISPASPSVYQGAGTSVALYLNDQGSSAFAGMVELSVISPPAGVTVGFSTPALSRNQNASITLSASTGATPGVYPILIRGQSLISGVVQSRSVSLTLNVLASTGVTGVKGRFVTPEGRGISNIIVRIADGPATQSDSAGNFTLTGLPAGEVTLRMDATPANPLYPIWPYS